MCRGKMIRFFNDEERALVNEFCDLREREHVIMETLKKGRSNDSIYKKIKAEQRRRCYVRAHAGEIHRQWSAWTKAELVTLAEAALDPKSTVQEVFERLGCERSFDSVANYLYRLRKMNQQEVRRIASGEAC